MKNTVILLLLLTGAVCAYSQPTGRAFEQMVGQIEEAIERANVQEIESANSEPQDVEEVAAVRAVWKIGSSNSLNFSQTSFSNWAAGGQGQVSLKAYTDWSAKMSKGRHLWENRFQAGYGFIHAFGDIYKKSDDKVVFDTKWGFQAYDKLYFSSAFNFTSQMTQGFEYPKNADPKKISTLMSPGYISLGLGIDYKPAPFFSISASPLTAKLVVVTDTLLRARYGNSIDKAVRMELGAQVKADLKKEIFKNIVVTTDLTLFSDYLGTPSNIKVLWNLLVDMKVNKFLSAELRLNMIYDDEIKITDSNGNVGARLQIKEVFGIGFTYKF